MLYPVAVANCLCCSALCCSFNAKSWLILECLQAEMNALKGHFFDQKRDFVTGRSNHLPMYTVQIEEIVHPNAEQPAIPAM